VGWGDNRSRARMMGAVVAMGLEDDGMLLI